MRRATSIWGWISINIAIAILMTSLVAATNDMSYCQRSHRNCRLKTDWNELDGHPYVKLNISCFCESDEPEEIWEYLNKMSTKSCSYLPVDDGMKVNLSTIHITGCYIQKQVFPTSIIDLARRTDHLEIVFNRCPYIRLGSITHKQLEVPKLTVNISDSKLSGLPRGWLHEAKQMVVNINGSDIPVIEPKAISGLGRDADVSLEIVNTNISTVKMLALDLPPKAKLTIKESAVTSWEKLGYKGGSTLSLDGVKFSRILGDAFNLQGVKSFTMASCNVAELLAEAVTDNGLETERIQDTGSRSATIMHNVFTSANGAAFINLCKFSQVLFQHNVFHNLEEAPPRLQNEQCTTKRNWMDTVTVTGLNCKSCEDFANIDEQSCAFYRSGYCSSCSKTGDTCNKPVMMYIFGKCSSSHPQVAQSLKDICKFDPDAPVASPRSLNGIQALVPSITIITVTVAFLSCLQTI